MTIALELGQGYGWGNRVRETNPPRLSRYPCLRREVMKWTRDSARLASHSIVRLELCSMIIHIL